MQDVKTPTSNIVGRPTPFTQRRSTGALLIAGPLIFLLIEFIAAAAWVDTPYSYTRNFISNLGVQGPSTLFGQYMFSPLYWLMNTGFIVYGIVILAGVILLKGLTGWRRWAAIAPAIMLAAGSILLGTFPGSGESVTDGTGDFHSNGAFTAFFGANILVIVLGLMRERIGLSRAMGRALIIVGIVGLISAVLYFVTLVSGGEMIGIIGLIERGATHPFLIGLLCAGVSIVRRRAVSGAG
jgi:hypothetical membrane protein